MRTAKLVCAILAFTVLLNLFSFTAFGESAGQSGGNGIKVVLDGAMLSFDEPPLLIGSRTIAPMYELFGALGADVLWDANTKAITAEKDGIIISMQLDSVTFSVNGQGITLDTPPQLIGDVIFVPIRAVAEHLNLTVIWDGGGANTVYIMSEGTLGAGQSVGGTPAVVIENEEAVFATLHGEIATIAEFMYFYSSVKLEVLNSIGIMPGDEAESSYLEMEIEGGITLNDYIKESALGELKRFKILGTLAKEMGTELDDQDWANIDAIVMSEIDNAGDEVALAYFIEQNYGISFGAFTSIFEQNVLNEKFYYELYDSISISDHDILEQYEALLPELESVTVRHILFMSEEENGERSNEEALALAEDILARVEAGEDMKALADDYSEDPGVVENSGEYTFDRYANLVPEFIEWGFSAGIGECGIITTTYGFHVMKLEAKDTVPFDDIKEDILLWMKDTALNSELDSYMVNPDYELIVDEGMYSRF